MLQQTFEDFELLLVDDGSTDSSPDIIKRFENADARVRVFRHEKNAGLVAALNLGLQHARGELIARMDSDDISLPSACRSFFARASFRSVASFIAARLAEQVRFLDAHPHISLLGTAVEIFSDPVPTMAPAAVAVSAATERKPSAGSEMTAADPGASSDAAPAATRAVTSGGGAIKASEPSSPGVAEAKSDEKASAERSAATATSLSAPTLTGSSRVIRHPASPGLVHWSMFFYCALAHPTVMARRSVFEVSAVFAVRLSRCWFLLFPL